MQYTKVPSNTFERMQMNAGIVVDSFNPATGAVGNILGATTGGLQFNANPQYEDFGEDVDNVPPNTWQLKRVKSYDPALSGNFVSVTPALVSKLSGAGGYETTDTKHYIPTHTLTESDFEEFWVVGDYSAHNSGAQYAGYVAIHIKKGLNTGGFQWTTTKDGKGQFAFDIHGHYDINYPDIVPYEIYIRVGTSGTLTALTVTSVAGTAEGDSTITVSGYTLGDNDAFVYATGAAAAPTVTYGQILTTWTELDSGDDITPTEGHTKIAVAVINENYEAIAYGSATITVNS